MTVQLRHEINIINTTVTAQGDDQTLVGIPGVASFNGALTAYFEVVGKVASGTCTVGLQQQSSASNDASVAVTATSYTLYRSASFPLLDSYSAYQINLSGGTTPSIIAARVVILQNASTISKSLTVVEIGTLTTTTSTSFVALTNPKYWKYTSGNWDGSLSCWFEASIQNATTKSTTTAELQVADGTGDGFAGWAAVAGGAASSDVTTISTAIGPVVTSLRFTPISGRNYRVVLKTSSSKNAATIASAKIFVMSVDGDHSNAFLASEGGSLVYGGTGTSSETSQAQSQSFKINSTSTITGVKLQLSKIGSPSDTLNVNIVSSLGGSSLANASISCSSLTTSYVWYTLTFGAPVSLTGGTTYYIQLTRSGARDITNVPYAVTTTSGDVYSDGARAQRDNNTWQASVSTDDIEFTLIGVGGVTKVEPQYLMVNTLFTAGTGLQKFLTKWDSTEWSSVTNTYTSAVDAANNSTSVVELDTASGTQITGSVVTSPDNQGISSAMTMPADGNLDCKATTNNSDIYSSKILVACTILSKYTKGNFFDLFP